MAARKGYGRTMRRPPARVRRGSGRLPALLELEDAGVQHGALPQGGPYGAVQPVLQVELTVPRHDVSEQVAVERGVLGEQRREVQLALRGDQLIEPDRPGRDRGPGLLSR